MPVLFHKIFHRFFLDAFVFTFGSSRNGQRVSADQAPTDQTSATSSILIPLGTGSTTDEQGHIAHLEE